MAKQMFMEFKVFCDSEIQSLHKVIVHRPDEGINRISPRKAGDLLFDDIVHLPTMQREHETYIQVLNALIGKNNVLETERLIKEGLDASPEIKMEVLTLIKDFEELPKVNMDILFSLPNSTLAQVLISGYYKEEDQILFDPIPNFIFTRDIAIAINDHVVITKANKYVRHRENLLARFFFHAHPYFQYLDKENKLINLNLVDQFPPSKKGEAISIEGGDLMLLNKDYLLIGNSERTTDHAFQSLKKVLFEKNIVQNIVEVDVPKERSFMHIDTIFTQINDHHFVGYKPIVKDGLGSYVSVHRKNGQLIEYPSVLDFLLTEINPKIEFIWSGDGDSPYQEREQWTDGCNLLTVRPGVALTYDRNPMTELAFQKHGYTVIHAYDFLVRLNEDQDYAKNLNNTIITLPSSELSRARGGTHCMSCPILRQIQN